MSQSVLGVGLSVPVVHPNYADLGANIDQALAAGVTFVELPLQSLDLIVGARLLKPRVAEVAKIVADRPARTTLHGHLGINLMEEPHLIGLHTDVLKANIEVAQALGSVHLVIHAGFTRPLQQAAIEREVRQDHRRATGAIPEDDVAILDAPQPPPGRTAAGDAAVDARQRRGERSIPQARLHDHRRSGPDRRNHCHQREQCLHPPAAPGPIVASVTDVSPRHAAKYRSEPSRPRSRDSARFQPREVCREIDVEK